MRFAYSWYDWGDEYQWRISVLAAMHGMSTFEADFEVKKLQWKSFIYESSPLRSHDLYIEFAESLVAMEGSKEKEWWVGHRDANGYNPPLKRLLLSDDKSKICHPPKQLWECPNLEFLFLVQCTVTLNSDLDLKCFPNLRVLCVYYYSTKPVTLRCTSDDAVGGDLNSYGRKDRSKGCLPKLRMVQLLGFCFRRIPFLRQCWNLTYLSILGFDFEVLDLPQDVTSLFENLKALQTLILSSTLFGRFPSHVYDGTLRCVAKMKNLKCLEISRGHCDLIGYGISKLDLSPLGCLTSLETLSLPNLPKCVKELVGLDQLSQLVVLNVEFCDGLRKLANLDLLPNLRQICVTHCTDLNHPEDQLKCFQKLQSRLHEIHQCFKTSKRIRVS